MKLTLDTAQWLESCGAPILTNSVQNEQGFVELNNVLENIIINGSLVFNLLQIAADKSGSTQISSELKKMKIIPDDSIIGRQNNWNQLFRVLPKLGIKCTQEFRRGIMHMSL